ncbi:zinc-dependent peptidase [Flaviramulus sp. BrNp1-15]|uniref:zinc-dependent peptidase n=1 Tax=Flaviramulus sp. BrNp1-15 TaxID=2916754 RepID=UPI001EE99070|nr:zinc-dependent peptidase [Flaviramulus sp. BrNp1-15]ULC60413.1 zinc-dependent peptidase [Flaviramulus sp. BrNp1-15]
MENFDITSKIILYIFFVIMLVIFLRYTFKMVEMAYVLKYKKPLYNHFYFNLKKLNKEEKSVLKNQFPFYKKLTDKEKRYFEHRVSSFIKDKDFIGREDFEITDEIKVLVSATAIMLTFGFRDFYIDFISKIVIYPNEFFSNTNSVYHKGEFNPKLKTLVLSWEDFKLGFDDENDNLNLGIHEFTHAIHLSSLKDRDVSSIIFLDTFKELTTFISRNETLRKKLIDSGYFREYAFTNQFEFLSVLIENFIETPNEFRALFPDIYNKTKQMLNFNFAGY